MTDDLQSDKRLIAVAVRRLVMFALLLAFSWLAMMAVHELGHVLHAWASGGTVTGVVLHPLAISRTDVSPNPHPRFVAWGGAIWGSLLPVGLWLVMRAAAPRYAHVARFFAGFCLLANGLYLAGGSIEGVGDAGDLVRHGAARWQLWLFGVPASALGLWLWHGLSRRFTADVRVERQIAIALALSIAAMAALGILLAP
jgi:hypothetical protein